jgi:hypothetical protein
MGQDDSKRTHIASAVLALALFASCKVEQQLLPTGPTGSDSAQGTGSVGSTSTFGASGSQQLTAPIIADPLSGSTVSETQPELRVLNSARSGDLVGPAAYLFQVSADTTFASLEAQSSLVPEEADGSTSWSVDRALAQGRHFWRVRTRVGTTDSSFSATADFTVGASSTTSGTPTPNPNPTPTPTPSPPTGGTILSDPLTGGSMGEVSGGTFTSRGWRVDDPGNYIRYEVPPLDQGWVEFDTTGLREINPSPDEFMLFGMWDPSAGPYRENPFRVHLQKLHPNPHNPPYLRMRWISNGEQHDEGSNFYDWNPNQNYHWRIEWGPNGDSQLARVLLDGQLMIRVSYRRPYEPNVHFIELGIGERGETVTGVIYSNFRVGK